jgi:hypothetical protein
MYIDKRIYDKKLCEESIHTFISQEPIEWETKAEHTDTNKGISYT